MKTRTALAVTALVIAVLGVTAISKGPERASAARPYPVFVTCGPTFAATLTIFWTHDGVVLPDEEQPDSLVCQGPPFIAFTTIKVPDDANDIQAYIDRGKVYDQTGMSELASTIIRQQEVTFWPPFKILYYGLGRQSPSFAGAQAGEGEAAAAVCDQNCAGLGYSAPPQLPVGGISLDPGAEALPLQSQQLSGSDAWLLAQALAATAATAVVLAGAAWYVRRRRVQ